MLDKCYSNKVGTNLRDPTGSSVQFSQDFLFIFITFMRISKAGEMVVNVIMTEKVKKKRQKYGFSDLTFLESMLTLFIQIPPYSISCLRQ